MSTYYEYREVKVMIAHRLMCMDGWKVYHYSPDQSDSMTDYYNPAHWGGIAVKNGYILCVDVYGAAKEEEIRQYNNTNLTYNKDIQDKIKKLEQMTVERGASEQEEESAKNTITRLQEKAEQETENSQKYIVTDIIPAHQAHPPKCNWHIEKDGVIIAKGNGLLKYSSLDNYYSYDRYMDDMRDFKKMTKEEYINNNTKDLMDHRYYSDEENARKSSEQHYNDMIDTKKLMDQFEAFINKIDTTCGGLLGTGDGVIYEKVTVTEYKTENKAVKTESGSIKDGQCFILTCGFNYGRSKGFVYRIHEIGEEGQKYFTAYKLNGKLTKECHGMADQSNTWYMGTEDRLTKWIDKGSISWCEIKEVKTPYEVEKVVKKVISNAKPEQKEQPQKETNTTEENKIESADTNNLHYDIKEDIDTRNNDKLYVVKVEEKLTKEEYIKVNQYIKSLGGYYSKFKHGFIFKDDPTSLLSGTITEVQQEQEKPTEQEQQEKTPKPPKKNIEYDIEQSQNNNKQLIWLVKVKSNVSKDEFTKIKQNFATLKGFYSGLYSGFIFKYDPTEKIKSPA